MIDGQIDRQCMNKRMRTYIHACVHTCLHANIHTRVNAYLKPYIHAYTHTHTCIPAYMHAGMALDCIATHCSTLHHYMSMGYSTRRYANSSITLYITFCSILSYTLTLHAA